jgi:hypothetical protein
MFRLKLLSTIQLMYQNLNRQNLTPNPYSTRPSSLLTPLALQEKNITYCCNKEYEQIRRTRTTVPSSVRFVFHVFVPVRWLPFSFRPIFPAAISSCGRSFCLATGFAPVGGSFMQFYTVLCSFIQFYAVLCSCNKQKQVEGTSNYELDRFGIPR